MRITKALKTTIENLAKELVQSYNPYTINATKYFVGDTTMFICANTIMTKEQIDNAYYETAVKDITREYIERMAGYYDKWYRYSHADEGRAYDRGQRLAIENPKCSCEFHIIECNG